MNQNFPDIICAYSDRATLLNAQRLLEFHKAVPYDIPTHRKLTTALYVKYVALQIKHLAFGNI